MAQYFFDTSAIVKYYHAEAGSPLVLAIFNEPKRRVRISNLGFLEMQSAFAMKVRSRVINLNTAEIQRVRMLVDIASGNIEVCHLTNDHYISAERLILAHAYSKRLRTLDALQLAIALDLASQHLLERFVVADQALVDVANAEGLNVLNPEA